MYSYLNNNVAHSGVVLWVKECSVLVKAELVVEVHVSSVPAALIITLHLDILGLTLGVGVDF